MNIADRIVVVALVDGTQSAFSGDAKSITESTIFVLTISFWSWFLNGVSFRFESLERLTASPPMTLVDDGRPCRVNLRKARMTRE